MVIGTTIEQYLANEIAAGRISDEVAKTILCIVKSATELSQTISRSLPAEMMEGDSPKNCDGDSQKPLDMLAHNIFERNLASAPVSYLISEEIKSIKALSGKSSLCVAIDPLDGSSNIETNLSIGSIFSVLKLASKDTTEPVNFVQQARQLAAGFFVYGPRTTFAVSCGKGTSIFILDPDTSEFLLSRKQVKIPGQQREFAINTSNYRHWDSTVRHFVDDCIAGKDGPLCADYNMRWNASLVAEAFRILTRGGVFLYPRDRRPGYENGRIRLLYEAMPIAFVIEQAGGKASDGVERIMERKLTSLHGRSPLIFGSGEMVDLVLEYFTNSSDENSRFPLFGSRSLLRN